MKVFVYATLLLSSLALPLTAAAAEQAGGQSQAKPSGGVPAAIQQAIEDPARKADRHIDARRKMAAVMTFTGVEPGDTVVELVPGSGYWTRVFSQVVGQKGHVYTVWPTQMMKYARKSLAKWKRLSAGEHYANVTELVQSAQTVKVPVKADIVFTSNNYHDYHNLDIDIAGFNQSVYKTLKPGGSYIVIDHTAPAGSGTHDTNTLHRIDPAAVKQEVEAAGFRLVGKSHALHNPDDPLDVSVFDKSIRGYTDQFIFRFQKPAHSK